MSQESSIFHKIDSTIDDTVKDIQKYIQVPSVVYEPEQVKNGSEYTKEYLKNFGCSRVELIQTPGAPIVFGEYNANADKTLVVYLWYDTDKLMDGWSSPPLEGNLVDMASIGTSIVGRGAFTKGSLVTFMKAMEAMRSSDEIPVNLKFVLEGDENLVSPNLPFFVEKHGDLVKGSNGVLFPRVAQDKTGKVVIKLGGKGLLQMQITCSGELWGRGPTKNDIHGSEKAWVDSPYWRLIKALSSMVSQDGNKVTMQGFYDKVAKPKPSQEKLVDDLLRSLDEDRFKKELGVKAFIDDLHGKDLMYQYLFQPTFNIQGIESGGGGIVIPRMASAKIEIRLVPNQSADDLLKITKDHLEKNGFGDISVSAKPGIEPSTVDASSSIVQSIVKTYDSFNVKYEFWPNDVRSPPHGIFSTKLRIPVADGGLGHGGRHHAPDEYIVVKGMGTIGDLPLAEKSFVRIVQNFSNFS